MTFNTHDQVPDSPTNTFATFNPLVKANVTLSNGNLTHTQNTWSNTNHNSNSTLAIPVGKFYWEGYYYRTSGTKDNPSWGVFNNIDLNPLADAVSGDDDHVTYWPNNADANNYYKNGSTTNTTGGHSTGSNFLGFHIAMCCVEMDANGTGKIWFGSNGAWHNGGSPNDPSTDDTYVTFTSKTVLPYFDAPGGELAIWIVNFGQDRTFGGYPNSLASSSGYSDANGMGNFYYQPPTGALALCSANLRDPIINPLENLSAEDFFKCTYYSGSTVNDLDHNTGLRADLVWVKKRNNTERHLLVDSVRGGNSTSNFVLYPDLAVAQEYDNVNNNNWGTLITSNTANSRFKVDANQGYANDGHNFVCWAWRAGGSPSGSNIYMKDGTGYTDTSNTALFGNASNYNITPTKASIGTKQGFGIYSFTASSGNTKLPHGLGKTPEFVIIKCTNLGSTNWVVTLPVLSDDLYLNTTSMRINGSSSGTYFQTTADSNTITFGLQTTTYSNKPVHNGTTLEYVVYAFTSVEGYSAFGSYKSISLNDGTENGPFVYTGFKPAWLMIKAASLNSTNWMIWDNARDTYNRTDNILRANTASQEVDGTWKIDFVSNGFKIRTLSSDHINRADSIETYVYMAFAEQPGKYSNAR